VIFDLITAEYTCLAFVKIVSHVKTFKWLSVSILVTWLTFICQRCMLHCSFMFSWIFRICTSDFDLIIELSICMLVIMLNFLNFLVKCVSLYFSSANVTSWVQVHFAQTSCVYWKYVAYVACNIHKTQLLCWFLF